MNNKGIDKPLELHCPTRVSDVKGTRYPGGANSFFLE